MLQALPAHGTWVELSAHLSHAARQLSSDASIRIDAEESERGWTVSFSNLDSSETITWNLASSDVQALHSWPMRDLALQLEAQLRGHDSLSLHELAQVNVSLNSAPGA